MGNRSGAIGRNTRVGWTALLGLCAALAGLPAGSGAPSANASSSDTSQAAAELERLRGITAGLTLPEQLKGELTRVTEALSLARGDLDAGRVHLAWWRLGGAIPELTALQAYAAGKDDPAAFERERSRAGDLAGEAAKALSGPALARAPAARRALAEAALNVVSRYESSGSAFAKASQAGTGIYYLNMAGGHLAFAALCAAGSPPAAAAGAIPPIDDRLSGIEQATAEAYAKPGAGLARHPEFIGLSATIKEARELSVAGLRHGALYKYLDARRRLRLLAEAPALPREELASRLESMRSRLTAGEGDHGIGWIFWEMAAFNLEAEGPEPQARLARAAAVIDDVLPEYLDIIAGRPAAAPPAVTRAKNKEEVRLTLVRWPYT